MKSKNIVILLAGGTGQRLGAGIPKQFVNILGKPMICYSLDLYQNNNMIDEIEIVCVPEYIDYTWELVNQFGYSKVKYIIPGGRNCQESTMNGLFYLEDIINEDDYVMFNMSSSLFVSNEIIEDSFHVAYKYGAAFACMPCVYNNAETENGVYSSKINMKEKNRTINMPWTARYGEILSLYHKAYDLGIEMDDSSYMPTLYVAMGEKLYFSLDDGLNKIHIQRPADMEIAEALIEHKMRKRVKK